MQRYVLMHKDTPCAGIIFEEDTWRVTAYHSLNSDFTPFLGNCDLRKFRRWWEMRAVPASRELMKRVMAEAGFTTPEGYLAKNLALFLTPHVTPDFTIHRPSGFLCRDSLRLPVRGFVKG